MCKTLRMKDLEDKCSGTSHKIRSVTCTVVPLNIHTL